MYVYDLRVIIFAEWRESLHAPTRWRRKIKHQSCLEEMLGES